MKPGDLKITSQEWDAFLDDFSRPWISSRFPLRSKPN
jgi:hypothetical protein